MESRKVPSSLKISLFLLVVGMLALSLTDCAGQAPPGGGPRDQEPPRVIKTTPEANAVRVKTSGIEIDFSEYVDRRSVEESIFISPYLGEPEFDWSGTSVTVKFPDTLRMNTTYVVNIGTDVIDQREQNRMAQGFTLAFSTGDSIDQGAISGRVFDENPEGVTLFAYALGQIGRDTLDPRNVKPDYLTQTGKGGKFVLANLALGPYRVFAIRDEYKNFVYDREVDQFGVTTGDIVLSAGQTRVEDVWFRLSREDTTLPFLTTALALDAFQISVRFSEPIDTITFPQAVFTLTDTLGRKEVPLRLNFMSRTVPSLATVITVTQLDSGAIYRLRVGNIYDRAGNPIDSLNASALFPGTSRRDTTRPKLLVTALNDSATGISPNIQVGLAFSKAVAESPLEGGVSITDAVKNPVAAMFRWLGPADLRVIPSHVLKDNQWYRLRVVMDSVRDLWNHGFKDSVFAIHFKTLDYQRTGTIEGTVSDQPMQKGNIYITAEPVEGQASEKFTTSLSGPGRFVFERLPEGKYTLSAFRDADNSGSYSCGSPYLFKPSERFALYPDTIKVRPRWSVDGVSIVFR